MKRFSFSRRVNPDSGPTVSRRSVLTLRYLCATLVLLFSLGIGQMWAVDPAVDDVIFKEEFGGNDIQANAYTFTGTTTWSGSTTGLAYASSSTSSLLSNTTATPITSDNFFFVKNAASTFTMSGIAIPSNVTSVTVSFQSNKTIVACTYSFTGGDDYTTGANSISGEQSFDIDCTNKSTLYLNFAKSGTSSNARIDNVTVTVKTISSGSGSSDPSVSVDPDALSFGTVEQNASVAAKTFSVTGSNLTGAITITSPNEGFTVTPASITPTDGAIAATDVTVTPVTSAANTFDGNVVISGGGLENNVTVALTMTVAAPVAVTEVTLDEDAISLEIGKTKTLTATVAPEEATNKNVTWESSDDAVATVENGVVTAVAVGNATITCKSVADNTITATCAVTVTEHVVTPGTYNVTLNNALFGSEATGSLSGDALHDYTGQQNDITFNYVKGSGSNMYMNASQIRLYKNITLVVSVPAGFNITEVTGLVANIAANVGSISNNTWTGKSNSITFSFTASSGNAQLGAISVTYAAIAPEVTVDPASLSFTAKQNIAVEGKTFTLTGANLTSGLTLAASAGFNVSPESITVADAMAQGGVEVTVTPATPTTTTTPVAGTVTISGGGLASEVVVNLSMAVTPTYAVAIAVNSNAMGSATINGGMAAVYVTDDEEIALVATPAEHHEFVNWTVSDENIVLDNENAATTTALAAAAGTITANFQEQACAELVAPTLDEITKTYQSATIAWNAVTNAEGYVLNITKHEDGSAVLTNELIVAPTVSFEIASGLAANTQYDYTVMAIGDGTIYCDANNPVLESNFTTNDYPAATLSLVENGGTPYNLAGSHKLNDVVTLPNTLQGLGCTGKVLVGWTNDENFVDTDDDPTGEDYYWAKGADYTIASTADKLYAVLATVSGGDWSKVEIASISEEDVIVVAGVQDGTNYYGLSSANGTSGSPTAVALTVEEKTITEGVVDAIKWNLKGTSGNYTLYANGTDNYLYNTAATTSTSGTNTAWRVGQPTSGTIRKNLEVSGTTLRTNEGSNQRYLCQYNNADWRGYVNNTSTNAKTTLAFFKQSSSTTGYTISCTAQLPVLDAPEFSLAAGSYYDALQTVTLTATNSADIYYTLDGTEPTTESTKYTGAIALNDRGEYTIWAIAVKEGYETSEIAKRTYDIVLPYDFADFAALEKVNGKEYAVRGIISQKDAQLYSGKLPYWISADGQTTGQIKCHNGLKENKANFESVDEVNLGDNVTVVGTWSTQYSNLNAGNWMLEYTARVHASYAIEGELTASSFDDGDAFDDAILDNLTVKETFTNGYHENVAGVTFNAGEKTAWADGDTKLTVNAVLNEAVIATKDFDVTVSSAQLASIALKVDDENYSTKVEYYLGDPFVAPTIVATLDDASSYEAVATYVSGFDNTDATTNNGVQEVTVSYTRGDVTKQVSYNITMKKIFDNEDAPHTVAEANALINAHGTTSASSDYMWVRGIVSGFKGTSNNQYYISDDGTANDQLYVYNGKYFGEVTMNATNKPEVGDVVILKSKMQIYSNAPELSSSVVVYQLRAGALSIEDVTGFEVGSDDLNVTVTTASDGDITFVSGDEAVVTIVDGNLHAVAAGTATITANLAATENEGAINYTAASTTFSVTVIATLPRYTVIFDANGGTGTDPVIADQLEGATVELPANPYSKENSAFAGWLCDADGQTYEEGAEYTMTAANVKFTAQWNIVATCAISFQIGGQEVATANAPQTVEYTFTQVGADVPGFTFLGWSETEVSGEAEEMPTIITSYTPEAGESSLTLYGIYSRVDDSDPSAGLYVKANTVEDGDYLIVCESESKVFDGSLATLDAASNTQTALISEGVLTLANADNYVFTIAAKTGGYSIKSASDKYIGQTSDANGLASGATDTYTNSISISVGNVDIIGSGNAHLRYNKTSGQERFRYFKSTSYSGQTAIQLYKKNVGTTYYTSSPVEKVTITFNANGGQGGCQTTKINKGGQLTICAEVPTKAQSEFAGWKDMEANQTYTAGQTIENIQGNITLTAQWNEAAKYTVTYAKGGDDVTGDVPTDTESPYFAGEQVTVLGQGELAKEGLEFKGWEYDGKLYRAGDKFTMPAADVILTAQWQKENIEKYNIITDASQLVDGMKVVIAEKVSVDAESCKAMGSQNTNNRAAVDATLSGNVLTLNDDISKFTLVRNEDGMFSFRTSEGKYLYAASSSSNYLREQEELDANGKWKISFYGREAIITAQGNNARNQIRLNTSGTPFSCYGTGQQASVCLYGQMIVAPAEATIGNPVAISDLGYVEGEPLVVNEGQEMTIDVNTNAPSLTVEMGAKVTVTATVTYDTYIFKASQCNKKSNQTANPGNITANNVFFDLQLSETAVSEGWYSFTVPFPVSASDGIYNAKTGVKMAAGTDYRIMTYDSNKRANGDYGWVKTNGTLVPGQLYIIALGDTEYTDIRFRKLAGQSHDTADTWNLSYATGDGDATDYGWNGIGNGTAIYRTATGSGFTNEMKVQFLDHENNKFTAGTGDNITYLTNFNFTMGAAFFVQIASQFNMTWSATTNGTNNYAPARAAGVNTGEFLVRLGKDTESFTDQVFVSASEDAKDEYQIGHDLVRFGSMGASKTADMYVEGYNHKLCDAEYPLVDGSADFTLGLEAPEAGTYNLYVAQAQENATLYLTYEGQVVWNLSMGAYELDLAKGKTTGYGLRIVDTPSYMPTGTENTETTDINAQKVVIDGQLYILRDGKMFDATGREVK